MSNCTLIDMGMYALFLSIPFLMMVIFTYISGIVNLFWYELLVAWILPCTCMYTVIHPIRHLYQDHLSEYIDHPNNQVISVYARSFTKMLLTRVSGAYVVWYAFLFCLSVLEAVVYISRNDDVWITRTFTSFYLTSVVVILFLCLRCVITPEWMMFRSNNLHIEGTTNANVPVANTGLPPPPPTPAPVVSLGKIDTETTTPVSIWLGISFLILVILFSITWFPEISVVVLYIFIVLVSLIIWAFHNYQYYIQQRIMLVSGTVTYMVLLFCTFCTCTLFTQSYNEYYLSSSQSSMSPFALYILFLLLSQILHFATNASIRQMCGPYVHQHYLYPQILCHYACQFVAFGFTPISYELIILNIMSVIHHIFRAGNVYNQIVRCCWSEKWIHEDYPLHSRLFESITMIFSDMQLHIQETLCSLQTIVSLSALMYWYRYRMIDSPISNSSINQWISNDNLAYGILIQVGFKIMTWYLTGWIIRKRLVNLLSSELTNEICRSTSSSASSINSTSSMLTLSNLLSQHLQTQFGLSPKSRSYAYFMSQYENDHKDVWKHSVPCASASNEDSSTITTSQQLVYAKSTTWILKTHFLYCVVISFLVYVCLLSQSVSAPIRYVFWFLHHKDS